MARRVDKFADFLARTESKNTEPTLNVKIPVSTGPRTIRVSNQLAYWGSSRSAPVGFRVPPFKGINTGNHGKAENLLEKLKPRGLPSRMGNIFVAEDPNNVLMGSSFGGRANIYKVKVDGVVFKANLENYTELVVDFTKGDYTEEQISYWAKEYWKGIDSSTSKDLIEWIVDGTVEVIEEI